jgi:hypothetical protein
MTERTATGNRKPPIRRSGGRSSSRPRGGGWRPSRPAATGGAPGERFGANAGKGSLAALPWALALLATSAVLAAATVIGR